MNEVGVDVNGPIFGSEHFAQRMLSKFRAVETWERIAESNFQFDPLAELAIQDYESEQIAGLKRVSSEYLLGILQQVETIRSNSLRQKTLAEAKSSFDNELAKNFSKIFPLAPSQAAKPEVWLYLSARIFPELINWRFSDSSGKLNLEDRVFSRFTDRHALARLWWQSAKLDSNLLHLRGDTRDQISERGRTLLSRPAVSNAIFKWLLEENSGDNNESEVIKSIAPVLTREFALFPVDLLNVEETEAYVYSKLNSLFQA